LLEHAQIPVSPYKVLSKQEFQHGHFSPQKIIDDFDLPLFIKEPHGGSSVGVTKIHRPDQFYPTLQKLFQHEQHALIEQTMKGREIECSILTKFQDQSLQWMASLPGEILPQREFYDYIAKYIEDTTRLDVPADLPKELIKQIQNISIKAAKTVGCYGMARVDCFLENNNIFVNEINTIPGFTSISMYPSLWKVSGIETSQLIDNLIQAALYRKESQP
jgi:D-alanine-D-alanine ligase